MRQRLLAIFLCFSYLGCAASAQKNKEIAELRTELKADRELLAQTRAELNEVIEILRPLAELAKFAASSGLLTGIPDIAGGLDINDNLDEGSSMEESKDSPEDGTPDGAVGDDDELKALIQREIRSRAPNEYTVTRKVLAKILENPMTFFRGARIVPSIENGEPNGFKLYAIRPRSIFAALGIMNGDIIHAVNGFNLRSPDEALEVYTKLREADALSVNLSRRGTPLSITIKIVD